MNKTNEQILIVYSVNGTGETDLQKAQETIDRYKIEKSSITFKSKIFKIPDASTSGYTLPRELYDELTKSIGAVVFLDDLRANIAYELGFFHGQHKSVLLLTKQEPKYIWELISDLAGAALAKIDNNNLLDKAIERYLDRLYGELGRVAPWNIIRMPQKKDNIINNFNDANIKKVSSSEFGKSIIIDSWEGETYDIGRNISNDTKIICVIKAKKLKSFYTLYFYISYIDNLAIKKDIWVGLSSVKSIANLQSNERLVPSMDLTDEWNLIQFKLTDILNKAGVLDIKRLEYLQKIRIRAGKKEKPKNSEIEIGFLNIIGIE